MKELGWDRTRAVLGFSSVAALATTTRYLVWFLWLAAGVPGEDKRCDEQRVGRADQPRRPVGKLMYAAVIPAAERWRGIAVGEFEQRQLRAIREELRVRAGETLNDRLGSASREPQRSIPSRD